MTYSKIKWLLLTAVFIALTPAVFQYAYNERGYSAIGGEIFFPFIPLLIWAIVKTVKDTFKNNEERVEQNDQM
jgi:TRAP-type mannitol/chloroaromatic compound transport system permease small subunit